VAPAADARLVAAVVTPPPKTSAGIVFAMPIEAGRFADRVQDVRRVESAGLWFSEGLMHDRPIAWVVSGAGLDLATRACQLLIAGHRPRLVISAGFAGGLTPDMTRGSLVRPARAERAGSHPVDLARGKSTSRAQPLGIVTVDQVVRSAAAKSMLAHDAAADLVDMETWGVAAEAQAAGLPCECLRVVSDTCGEELPPEISDLAAARSPWRRLGAAIRTVGRRPSAAIDLWQLWERAVIDSRTLADALERRIAELPLTAP